jgi:hypothetical protein
MLTTSFRIIINRIPISYATQSLIDETVFYSRIQEKFEENIELKEMKISTYTPLLQPILDPNIHFFHLVMNTRISIYDRPAFENIIRQFIFETKTEFKQCKDCWKDRQSYNVKMVHTDTLIDSNA